MFDVWCCPAEEYLFALACQIKLWPTIELTLQQQNSRLLGHLTAFSILLPLFTILKRMRRQGKTSCCFKQRISTTDSDLIQHFSEAKSEYPFQLQRRSSFQSGLNWEKLLLPILKLREVRSDSFVVASIHWNGLLLNIRQTLLLLPFQHLSKSFPFQQAFSAEIFIPAYSKLFLLMKLLLIVRARGTVCIPRMGFDCFYI